MGIRELIDIINHDDEVVIVDDTDNCFVLWSGEAQCYHGEIDENTYRVHYIGGLWSGKIIIYVSNMGEED